MSYWRDRLGPASFRGVPFHVEVSASAGGRRVIVHEYPNKESGATEDLGRTTGNFAVTGYVIGSDFIQQRDVLRAALDAKGPGTLVLPLDVPGLVHCLRHNVTERRERGGIAEIEMIFVEANDRSARSTGAYVEATDETVRSNAEKVETEAGAQFQNEMRESKQ